MRSWIFVIIVLCGLTVYFVAGIIILRFVQHKEGREIVPQHEFWFGLPGLVIDGLKYVFCVLFFSFVLSDNSKRYGLCCVPCRGSSYTEV